MLDSQEREQLLTALEQDALNYFPLVPWLTETGCRISEVLTLTWGDLDLPRAEARLWRHKTGDEGYIELWNRLVDTPVFTEPTCRVQTSPTRWRQPPSSARLSFRTRT